MKLFNGLIQKENSLLSKTDNATNDQQLYDIIICILANFDLTPQNLLKEFHFLKTK